ncbi:hypothetical protein CONCODRAFT_9793 [Conidiobolus coronatus NRRL 28638]|uniref:Uncharacterized protein n=1 Tax=Conidiobolus coronatus (strain ATCC 28846 / CBS 209.66 / NRRL 28638) TaxID=796925 RepID=A0A137NYZ9_CONC2|nr:hypothetical protein CONCODRAFT_9793 [Conidiobolus coronatus NRRL 28638]|eukprot:KXN68063.1 hypothetical protein CONCODRAFT_9793 [Conidiobolus coronatus NRRL 28638]
MLNLTLLLPMLSKLENSSKLIYKQRNGLNLTLYTTILIPLSLLFNRLLNLSILFVLSISSAKKWKDSNKEDTISESNKLLGNSYKEVKIVVRNDIFNPFRGKQKGDKKLSDILAIERLVSFEYQDLDKARSLYGIEAAREIAKNRLSTIIDLNDHTELLLDFLTYRGGTQNGSIMDYSLEPGYEEDDQSKFLMDSLLASSDEE